MLGYLITLVPWYLGGWVVGYLDTWISGYLDAWVTLVHGDPNDSAFGRYGDGDLMIPVTRVTQ